MLTINSKHFSYADLIMDFDFSTETITPDNTSVLTIGGTGGLILPIGTTEQEPTASAGIIRFNSDTSLIEYNNGSAWVGVGSGGAGATGMATGTATAPGWAFTADTTTGLFQPQSNTMGLSVSGYEQLRLIKTTAAVNYITVTGSAGANAPIIGSGGTSTNLDLFLQPKGTGALYAQNDTGGLIFGAFNDAGSTASTNYITFTNAATTNMPYIQANGVDTSIDLYFFGKSATGGHMFSNTTSNNILYLTSVASGVNYLKISNATSTNSPSINATGTATNIGITFQPKGTGVINVNGPLTASGAITSTGILTANGGGVIANGLTISSGAITLGSNAGTAGQVLTSNGTGLSPSWTTVSTGGGGSGNGVPGGAINTVQYNSDGTSTFGGATNVLIDNSDLTLYNNESPVSPAASTTKLFCRSVGGRMMPAFVGPTGLTSTLQPTLARNKIGWWNPPGNATTVPGVVGFTAPTAGGTATARTVATTNILTRMKRLGYVSSTTAGNYGGQYVTAAQFTTGDGSGMGGFTYICRFGISDATLQKVARMFVGLSSSVAAPTNVAPSTLTNSIGVGHDASATTLSIYYAGTTNTTITLSSEFPVSNTTAYEIVIFSSPNLSGYVGITILNIGTGATYTTQVGNGTATMLPLSTTLLAHRAWRYNNTAAAAVGLDICSIYIETDN